MRFIILLTIPICFASCSPKNTEESQAVETIAVEEKPSNLVPEEGLRIITNNYYHLILKQKKVRPKNYFISRDTVVVTGKEDNYAYTVTEVLVDSPTEFKARIRGGHTELDKTPKDFEIAIQGGLIKTTKLENGASWIETTNNDSIVRAFELELDKQGFIFHR